MPNATPSARYDLPWKTALRHAFRAFIDFFFPDLAPQIDWSQRPLFRDKELAGISLGDGPDSRVADKLVEVALRDGGVQWVLVHVEVQAQRDAALGRRVLDYNYRIFSEYKQPVASLVILADEDPHWRPQAFHNKVLGTVMGIAFATAKLMDYTARTEELSASHNPFAWITLAHLRTQQARHDPDQLLAAKRQLTRLLYQHRWTKERIIVLFKVINWMMALPEPHRQRYWRDILKLEKERKMELLTPLEQSFLDEGWQKGFKQGRKDGIRAMLERQLTRRFGPLSRTTLNKLDKASLQRLEAWSDALPEAETLKQVFG